MQSIFDKGFTEYLIGIFAEEVFFKIFLIVSMRFIIAIFIFQEHAVSLIRQQLSGNFCSCIYCNWVNQKAIFHTMQQTVLKSRFAIFTTESGVSIQQHSSL